MQNTSDSSSKESLSDRFKSLRRRLRDSSIENRKEVFAEHEKAGSNPRIERKLKGKQLDAENKLAKLEAEENGEDFERKRAWDWTIEESKEWDARNAKKRNNRLESKSKSHSKLAKAHYERQLNHLEKNTDNKADLNLNLESAEIEGTDADLDFVTNYPSKQEINELMKSIRKEDETRAKNRSKAGPRDAFDVTYINARNQRFNDKLMKHYDKYTKEIRENLERGTAL